MGMGMACVAAVVAAALFSLVLVRRSQLQYASGAEGSRVST
jgi:hypothetical protein